MLCRLLLQCGKLFFEFFLLPLVLRHKVVYACPRKSAECVILIQLAYDFLDFPKPFLNGSPFPLNQTIIHGTVNLLLFHNPAKDCLLVRQCHCFPFPYVFEDNIVQVLLLDAVRRASVRPVRLVVLA